MNNRWRGQAQPAVVRPTKRVIDMWQALLTFLSAQPLILFFLVAALGYLLGQLKIGGSTLGIAAVLFVGLAFGALDEFGEGAVVRLDDGHATGHRF